MFITFRSRILQLISPCLVVTIVLLATQGCRPEKHSKTGCMDTRALNYDATANATGVCTYRNTCYAGAYAVADTYVSFHHDATRGWYDTLITHLDIQATATGTDSLVFDTIIVCPHCNVAGGQSMAVDFSSFYFADGNYPVEYQGRGGIKDSVLFYNVGTSSMSVDGAFRHYGRGPKR